MASPFPTKLIEAFATEALVIYYNEAIAEKITNQNYEGQVRGKSSKLNILTFSKITAKNYTGSNLSVDDPTESNALLETTEKKAFYFEIKSYDTFRSYLKNPENTLLDQVAQELKEVIDTFIFGFYTKVAAGNRIGTDVVTGTVTVDVTTGLVTGSGTAFTAAMIGRGFKATGHTQWYRVKSYSSSTSIVIEDDLDDITTAYTGGAIAGGTAYTVEAATSTQVTATNVYQIMNDIATKLDNAKIPADNRFIVVTPEIASLIRQSVQYVNIGNEVARNEVVKRGLVGMIAGLMVYKSPLLTGNSTDGWHCLAGHTSAITFAMGLVENGVEDLIANFGKAYKSLHVYGAKVPDERRKALAEAYLRLTV